MTTYFYQKAFKRENNDCCVCFSKLPVQQLHHYEVIPEGLVCS